MYLLFSTALLAVIFSDTCSNFLNMEFLDPFFQCPIQPFHLKQIIGSIFIASKPDTLA